MNKAQRAVSKLVGERLSKSEGRHVDERDSKLLASLEKQSTVYQARQLVEQVKREHPELFEDNPLDSIPLVNTDHDGNCNIHSPHLQEMIGKRIAEVQQARAERANLNQPVYKSYGSVDHFQKVELEDSERATASLWPNQRLGESRAAWEKRMLDENTVKFPQA
jgi:hypothetical protein